MIYTCVSACMWILDLLHYRVALQSYVFKLKVKHKNNSKSTIDMHYANTTAWLHTRCKITKLIRHKIWPQPSKHHEILWSFTYFACWISLYDNSYGLIGITVEIECLLCVDSVECLPSTWRGFYISPECPRSSQPTIIHPVSMSISI